MSKHKIMENQPPNCEDIPPAAADQTVMNASMDCSLNPLDSSKTQLIATAVVTVNPKQPVTAFNGQPQAAPPPGPPSGLPSTANPELQPGVPTGMPTGAPPGSELATPPMNGYPPPGYPPQGYPPGYPGQGYPYGYGGYPNQNFQTPTYLPNGQLATPNPAPANSNNVVVNTSTTVVQKEERCCCCAALCCICACLCCCCPCCPCHG